jgi:hypothetical protein
MNIPGAFITGYMKAHPHAKAADIIKLYNDLVSANPDVVNMSDQELHNAVCGAVKHHYSNGGMVHKYADGGEVEDQPQPQSIDVNEQSIKQNAPLIAPEDVRVQTPNARTQYDPYAGADYKQSDLMQQFDPAKTNAAYDTTALRNAQAEQDRLFQQTQQTRQNNVNSRFIGALGGNADALKAGYDQQDKMVDAQQAQNLLKTITNQSSLLGFNIRQQEALQTQATAGLNAGKSVVDIAKDTQDLFGKFADNVTKGLSTEQQQRMNDPDSPETLSAKALLGASISTLSDDVKAQMAPLLSSNSVTAAQLMPAMAQFVPDAYKSFTSKAGIGKTDADTAAVNAGIPGTVAESRIKTAVGNSMITPAPGSSGDTDSTPMPTKADATKPGQEYKDNIDLNNMTAEQKKRVMGEVSDLADNKPTDSNFSKIKGAISGETIKNMAGMNPSLNLGGVSLTPTPAVTGGQGAAAKEEASNREQSAVSNKYALEDLSSGLAKKITDEYAKGNKLTGNMHELLTRRFGYQDAEQVRAELNKLVEGKVAYAAAAGGQVLDKDREVERIMQMSPKTFRAEMLMLNQQVGRQELRQKALTDYIAKTGTATGFDDQAIKAKKYLYNPTTGARGFVSPDKLQAAKKAGYKELGEL